MYCVNCGKEIADRAAFCPYCGASVDAVPVREYDPYVEDVLDTGEPTQEEVVLAKERTLEEVVPAESETMAPATGQRSITINPVSTQETVSEQPTAKATNGFAIAGFVCSFLCRY